MKIFEIVIGKDKEICFKGLKGNKSPTEEKGQSNPSGSKSCSKDCPKYDGEKQKYQESVIGSEQYVPVEEKTVRDRKNGRGVLRIVTIVRIFRSA